VKDRLDQQKFHPFSCNTQDIHSDRRKRRIKALNFTVFRRNPLSRITSRVFLLIKGLGFKTNYVVFSNDGLRRRFDTGFRRFLSFSTVSGRLRRRGSGPG
jgi:hypothetical protein